MIIEHTVEGSMNTSLHDFNISAIGMKISLSPGSYHRAGNTLITISTESVFDIPSPLESTYYEIWLTSTGAQLKTDLDMEVLNPIDRLVWFSVPSNCTSLNNVDIHFVKVVTL